MFRLTNTAPDLLFYDVGAFAVEWFEDMTEFLAYANGPSAQRLRSVSITGVGSSALGSAAFAWSASCALGEPSRWQS
jgi:hypothetical protein